ncbi:MAG TPA: tetratricopeptide repeat protein [Methylomirabilota bacterium]|nr:tetratricopeptide repeat protein [Methylomirabilota bacterium]
MQTWLRVILCCLLAPALLAAGTPGSSIAADTGPSGSSAPVDPDYTSAVNAIKAGSFASAVPLLEGVVKRDDTNADAHNMLAYAIRKNGDPARSIPIYQKALAIDPKHRGAHEYIGEAYLALDDLGKAKEHLKALDKLCFLPCSEYRDLKKAVEVYEKSGGKVKPQATK